MATIRSYFADITISFLNHSHLHSPPKVSRPPQKKLLARFPSFSAATIISIFIAVFLRICKITLGRGNRGKSTPCEILLSEMAIP